MPEMGKVLALLVVGLGVAAASPAAAAQIYDLQDLSAEQQAELWRQLEVHAAAVAMLNYCRRPPLLQERLSEIAADCVNQQSWSTVTSRFQDRLRAYQYRWDCSDPANLTSMVAWERKINALVRAARRVCR
jgi:hypothetical protein